MGAIKLLVAGFEASGKSTLASQIKDVLVINLDRKSYTLKVPHFNYPVFNGFDDFKETIKAKVRAYKEKFGKLPDVIAFDTITQLYSALQHHCNSNYSGFKIHEMINNVTLSINTYIEEVLLKQGISVVILAHTIADEKTDRLVIPAQGAFAKAGSWHSIVNNSIFIDKSKEQRRVVYKSDKYPARTTLDNLPESVLLKDFDINEYINTLKESGEQSEEFAL